jgi:succinyl-CoA synthetase alpha subunit
MGILADRNTRVLVQGITGREGGFHAEQMRAYGTQVVGGVTPGKGGRTAAGVPVFDSVRQAIDRTGADASVIFVPARFAKDAIVEAADAGIRLIVCITEGIPLHDMIEAVRRVGEKGARLVGPNGPGLATSGETKLGIIPGSIFHKGPVGLASRSGTLTYEVVSGLTRIGLGQSSCVGLGGDPILGSTFLDVLPLFEADPQTKAVVLLGEIGGTAEEDAAAFIRTMKKPVVGFLSGRTAPPGKRMGHAGAIISGGQGTADSKIRAWREAGVHIAETIREVPALVRDVLQGLVAEAGAGRAGAVPVANAAGTR